MLTEEKPAPAVSARYSGPVGRLRFIATFVAPALVVVLLAAGIPYVANYQPLRESFVGWGGKCLEMINIPTPADHPSTDLAFMTCRKTGDVISWGYSLSNDGPLAMRINYIGPLDQPGSSIGFFGPIEVRTYDLREHYIDESDPDQRVPDPGRFDELKPFAPFVIEPGEGRFIAFRVVLDRDCDLGGVQLPYVVLWYKVLGISRTDRLFAPIALDICGQPFQ